MLKKKWLVLLTITVMFVAVFEKEPLSSTSPKTSPSSFSTETVSGEIIVKFREPLPENSIASATAGDLSSLEGLNRKFGLKKSRKLFGGEKNSSLSNIYKLTFSKDIQLSDVIKEYSANPLVEYAEPNYKRHTFIVPNDPFYSQQWAHNKTQSELAWNIEKGNQSVIIAIIDTGVDWNHPDLAKNIWNNTDEIPDDNIDNDHNGYVDDVRGYDFVNTTQPVAPGEDGTTPDNDPMDFNGHGTHVAGIAAAVTNNNIGVAGMSWFSKIMPVRAGYEGADGRGYLEDTDAVLAIEYAADNNATIINMSWGGYEPSSLIKDAIDYAYNKGVILVAAAGNEDGGAKIYPAGYDNVIAVAATDTDDSRSKFSVGGTNYGSWIDVAAPGGGLFSSGILSTVFDDSYTYMMGTSMATPFVAGLAALIKSKNPAFTNEEVRSIIKSTTDPIQPGQIGLLYIGTGRINAYKALQRNSTVIANLNTLLEDAFATTGTLDVNGTVVGISSNFTGIDLSYGAGFYPTTWTTLNNWSLSGNGTYNFSFAWNTAEVDDGTYSIKLQALDIYSQVAEDRVIVFVDNSRLPGWPVSVGSMTESSPVLWDLNGDNKLEVVVGSTDGKLYVFNSDGSLMPGWPRLLDDYAVAMGEKSALGCTSPAIADLDKDGDFEIVVKSSGYLHVLHHNGTDMGSWPHFLGTYITGGPFDTSPEYVPLERLASPVVADIDNDGSQEIVVGQDNQLFAFRPNETLVSGWPVYLGQDHGETQWATPAVGDLDGDGDLEIVYQTSLGMADVWVLHYDGTNMSGWPMLNVYTASDCSPVLGDLDNDGKLEIVAGFGPPTPKVYVWNQDGTIVNGWPFLLPAIWDVGRVNDLSLGDVNGDGKLEVVCGSGGAGPHSVWILNGNGVALNNWPQGTLLGRCESNAALGDLDGDGKVEVITAVGGNTGPSMGMLYAWHTNGSLASGWPKVTPMAIHSSPTLGDLDGDGDVEVVVGCLDGKVYAWDMEKAYNQSAMQWPIFQHDERHTGAYPLRELTAPVTSHNYDGRWHNADFTITLTAFDSESGVTQTYYRINGGSNKTVSADGQPLITTEGADNTLEYWSVDNAYNEELPHKHLTGIKLDKTTPLIENLSRTPEGNVPPEQEIKVSANVTDYLSGVKNVTLSYISNNTITWLNVSMAFNSTTGLYECTIPTQQAHTRVEFEISAYDNAENSRTEDNQGQYYAYSVVPELSTLTMLTLLIFLSVLVIFLKKATKAV
jgi:subtilisin family serine protease